MDRWSIGKLARAASVSADTVRYYERRGLLALPARAKSGYRSYSEADLRRLVTIRRARAVGFSLSEIAELLSFGPSVDAARARTIIESKLAEFETRSTEIRQWRAVLTELLRPERTGATLESMLAAADEPDLTQASSKEC